MRVLALAQFFPHDQNTTSGNYVYAQCSWIKKLGHDVQVIVAQPYIPPFLNRFRAERHLLLEKTQSPHGRYAWQGIPVNTTQYLALPRYFLWQYRGWFMALAMRHLFHRLAVKQSFDLIHCHEPSLASAAFRLLSSGKVPVVLTLHGTDTNWTSNGQRRRAVRATFNRVDRIIIVGENQRRWAEQYCTEHDKIVKITNGIDPGWRCSEPPAELISRKGDKVVMLSVSILRDYKGIQDNLEAIAQLPVKVREKTQYWIVGDGPERAKLQELTLHLGIAAEVVFWGQVDYASVNQFYAVCDIFSLPSWNESFGLVYLEAMLHNKPVIGCQGTGAEETIQHEINGYLVPCRNPDKLAHIMKRLIENQELRRNMGAYGNKIATSIHTWNANAHKTVELYSELGGGT